MLETRARPVPFCLHNFLPDPDTSPLVFVATVPLRPLARYSWTASHSRVLFRLRVDKMLGISMSKRGSLLRLCTFTIDMLVSVFC